MLFNQKIFKAYDIRGIYDKDFSDDFASWSGLCKIKKRRNQ
jgi:phosphomannomutase